MYIFIVELFNSVGTSWSSVQFVLFIMIFHIGLTIPDAGIYKLLNGYLKNDGIQYALMNPFELLLNTNLVTGSVEVTRA